jgi:hypothetical protein
MAKPGIGLPVQFARAGWHAVSDAHKPNAGCSIGAAQKE